MKRFNLSLVLSLTIVFASGCAVGALVHRYYAMQEIRQRPPRPRGREEFRKAYMAEMQRRLKLTADQADRLKLVLDETEQKYRQEWEKQRPAMRAIESDQIARINAILTAEQQAEYAKMRKEREERRRKFEKK